MSRSIELTARSPHSVARIRSAFESEEYWRVRLTSFEVGSSVLNDLSTDSPERVSVTMTMRFSHDQVPEVMRRLRLPALEVVQREWWTRVEGGDMRGDITVDALRTPISGRGSVYLTSTPAGALLTGVATVAVRLPLIGGPIATYVAGLLADGILDIVRVTDSWLAENR